MLIFLAALVTLKGQVKQSEVVASTGSLTTIGSNGTCEDFQ